MLYRPATRAEAACYKGTKLAYWWEQSQGWPAAYYSARVVKVPKVPVEGDDLGIYLVVEFDDQVKGDESAWHDIEWKDFANPDICRITWLPERAKEQQIKQRELAKSKGKDIAGGESRRDAHVHLLSPSKPPRRSDSAPLAKKQKLSFAKAAQARPSSQPQADRGMARSTPPRKELARLAVRAPVAARCTKDKPHRKGEAKVRKAAGLSLLSRDGEEGPGGRSQDDAREGEAAAEGVPDAVLADADAADEAPFTPAEEPAPAVVKRPGKRARRATPAAPEEEEEEEEEAEPSGTARDTDYGRRTRHTDKKQRVAPPVPSVQPSLTNVGDFQPVEAGEGRGHAGQIKRLELENFMCHEHLVVDFNDRMNFMCGQNGSGKTAVLHGLQTCLGVSAKQSGRVTTGAEFIKDGSTHCKTAATIWNTGGDAYLPRKLGSEVTLVREMRRPKDKSSVTSTWSLHDAKGRKVASKRSDIDDLLKSLSVNAANPIVCLTQDTARNFGGSKASQELFRVFMEATQFEAIIEHLKLSEVEVEKMKARKKDLQKTVKDRKDELNAVQAKLDTMEEMRVWEEQQGHLQNWIAWEHVMEPKRKADDCNAKLQGSARERMEECQANCKSAVSKLAAARQEQEAQHAAIGDFPQRLAALQNEHKARQGLYQQAKKDCQRIKRDLQKAEAGVQDKTDHIVTLEESMAEMRTQLQGASESEEKATAAALRQKIVEAQSADAEVGQAKQEIREAQALIQQAAVSVRAAEESRDAAQRSVREANAALNRMQHQGDSTRMFLARGKEGPLSVLLRKIDEEAAAGRFDRKPLGPLGSLLTLTDDKWALAVEVAVGKTFNNLIVHSPGDANKLRALVRSIPQCPMPPYIVYSFDTPPYDLNNSSRPQVPEHLTTAFRVLKVKDMPYSHTVSNILVDQCAAERILLVENEDEGREAIRSRLSKDQIITAAWDQAGWHGYRRGQNETSFPLAEGRRIYARLRKDVAGAVREAQAEVQQLQQAHKHKGEVLAAAKAAEKAARADLATIQRELDRKSQAKTQLESQIHELRTQHESQTQHHEASVEDLGLQLADLLREKIAMEAQVEEKRAELREAESKEAADNAQMREKRAEMDEQLHLHERELATQTQCLAKVQEAEARVAQSEEVIKRLEEAVAKLESSKADFLAHSARSREMALQKCTEEEFEESRALLAEAFEKQSELARGRLTSEPPSDLDVMARWLNDLERKIALREQQVGATREELEAEKAEHDRWLEERQDELLTLDHVFSLFCQSYQDRRGRARKMRKDTLHAIENSFNAFLHQRGYTGSILMNWEEHTLELKVKVDPAVAAVTDTKSLSGGERSFMNMCFIMAVGKDISSPFHCLDEFDVFMDSFNRRKAIEMLMRFGAINEHLQLILLTPQSTHMIEDARQALEKSMKDEYPAGNFVLTRAMGDPRPRGGAA